MSPILVFAAVVLLCILHSLAVAAYNITIHPLAKFPGPRVRGAFYVPFFWDILTGHSVPNTKRLHDTYGDPVRISPNTLSFASSQAWKDIYGYRPGKSQIPKDRDVYIGRPDGVPDIIVSNDADHARIRRLVSHAFSEQALREQEPLITYYFDLLISRLHQEVSGAQQGKVNLVQWLNFTTFDILGDLCFDESFGALESGRYHIWVTSIFQGLKAARMFRIFRAYPISRQLFSVVRMIVPYASRTRQRHFKFTDEKTEERMHRRTDRKDIMSYILRYNDEKGMTRDEIKATATVLIGAGSETMTTLLSGTTFLLLQNPSCLAEAVREVRTNIAHDSDITFSSVLSQLPYLNACMEESMRLYPPVPILLPRRTGPQGDVIDGHLIPPNTSIGVHPPSANSSESNFKYPLRFAPERWLGDETYANDDRAACQPFSLGPRGCVGRNLAYAEMRSMMARVLWHFDIELCEESSDWMNQKVYLLWEKPPLYVKLTLRKKCLRG